MRSAELIILYETLIGLLVRDFELTQDGAHKGEVKRLCYALEHGPVRRDARQECEAHLKATGQQRRTHARVHCVEEQLSGRVDRRVTRGDGR